MSSSESGGKEEKIDKKETSLEVETSTNSNVNTFRDLGHQL